MDAGQLNDVLVLAMTLGSLLGVWLKWGRKWWDKAKASRVARQEFRAQLSKMVYEWHDKLAKVEHHMASVKSYMAESDQARSQLANELKQSSDKLDRRLDGQDTMLEAIAAAQAALAASQWAQMRFDLQARFQCDHTGRNIQVNDAYAKMMRVGERQLLEYDWKNAVVPDDRYHYERDAAQAFREHRRFERTVRFRRGDGTTFLGHVRIEPYPEDPTDLADGHHATWFGSVVVIEEIS